MIYYSTDAHGNIESIRKDDLQCLQSILRNIHNQSETKACFAEASNSVENMYLFSNEEKYSRRKSSYAKRDTIRTNLHRWYALRAELHLSKGKQLADF